MSDRLFTRYLRIGKIDHNDLPGSNLIKLLEVCFLPTSSFMRTVFVYILLFSELVVQVGSTRLPVPPPRTGKDLAVFFAVEKYQNSQLTNLQNPVKSARDIAAAIHDRFGFDTLVLVNPTQAQIIRQLNELTRLYARNEDGNHPSDGQLLLFFSGHGMSEDENGYFLPADANPAEPWSKGNAYEIWRPKINKINCRHILVALDACYSARFDPDWKNRPDGLFKRPGEMTDSQRAQANYETYQARVFYSSDNKETTTPDRSNFAKKMLEGLRSAQAQDGFLTSKQLFANYVEGATPTPRAGTFGDDEPSSAFLFYDRNYLAKAAPLPSSNGEADDLAWEAAKREATLQGFEYYLRFFTYGKHKDEAKQVIIDLQKDQITTTLTCRDSLSVYLSGVNTTSIVASQILVKGNYRNDNLYILQVDKEIPIGNGPWQKLEFSKSDIGKVYQLRVTDPVTGNKCWTKMQIVPENILPSVADDDLVLVHGGTFTMGCTSEQQDCSDDEKPTHQVTLSDFYIGKYEVTQKLWQQVMGTNPSKFTNCDDCPVEQVSWEDIQTFMQKLNQQTRKQYRLPTEAEWEFAARGGGKAVLFGNGKNTADPSQINFDASTDYKKDYSISGTYREKTLPVGSLNSPNALGLYDMSGNVWEWCSDWYGAYSSDKQTNPAGPFTGSGHACRGGSWDGDPQNCRVGTRYSGVPTNRSLYLGFRLAKTK